MCFPKNTKWDKEELENLGWGETIEEGPSKNELIDQYINYQWETYNELYGLVEKAGGGLVMCHFTCFLLDELH